MTQGQGIQQPAGKPGLGLENHVLVNMFDQTIKGSPGIIIGHGRTQKGEAAYLVQMLDTKLAARGRQDGCAQIEHGKEWVLSLYADELTPTTKQEADRLVAQSQARGESQTDKMAQTGR